MYMLSFMHYLTCKDLDVHDWSTKNVSHIEDPIQQTGSQHPACVVSDDPFQHLSIDHASFLVRFYI